MLTDIDRKDWGAMIPVSRWNSSGEATEGLSWVAVIEGEKETSIHEHDCPSLVVVIEGCVEVLTENRKFTLSPCQEMRIPAGIKHKISGLADKSVLLETYDRVNQYGEYNITRHEGWGDDTEAQVVSE